MAKSSIKIKSEGESIISKSAADKLILSAADYISQWTKKELQYLADSRTFPVFWPLDSGGLKIGNDRIIPIDIGWQRFDRNDEKKQIFTDKISALLYCLLHQMGHTELALEIERHDKTIKKLQNDIITFKYCLKTSLAEKNDFSITIYSSRLNNARLQLKAAKNHLEKTINSAKYLKVWDTQLCS